MLRRLGRFDYGCCFGCRLLVAEQIFIGNGVDSGGAVNSIVAVDSGLGLVELSDFIIKSGLLVDTWFSGASVNLVDLDAGVVDVFVVFIVLVVLRFC